MLEDYQVLTPCLKPARPQTRAQFQPAFNPLNPHENTHLPFVDAKAATPWTQDLADTCAIKRDFGRKANIEDDQLAVLAWVAFDGKSVW